MEPFLTENEKIRIHETIRRRYHKVAESQEGQFRYPTGIAGLVALPGKDFLAILKEAGFGAVELVKETGFNSTPNTKGVLIRARREAAFKMLETRKSVDESLQKYQTFFDGVYAEGVLDRKTKHLIALGASLAAGCQP